MLPNMTKVDAIMREVAAREVLPRFQNLSHAEIREKNPGDIVTIADEKAEAALDERLREEIPGSRAIGEEMAARDPSSMNALEGPDPVWIIDPVDGTQNYADGNPCFAMIIALVHNSETLAGWIYEPHRGHMVYAAKGQGAWEDGCQLRITDGDDLSELKGSLNKRLREILYQRQATEDLKIPSKMTRYRCVGAEYADLARGKLDFARYMGSLKPWDHAAGALIHAEAGGFNAYTDSMEAYMPVPPHKGRALLMAPDRQNWKLLHELTSLSSIETSL